jgi:hypothetical protein
MRDEPGLDEGGSRNPDGLGFAAFGFVAEGFEHLARFFAFECGPGPMASGALIHFEVSRMMSR